MMATTTDKAVILARGLGTRMRKPDASASVSDEQARIADTGVKALIPIRRPFLDYVLSSLADAGYRKICLVLGPEHEAVRDYYTRQVTLTRIEITFAIQEEPLGTADAVAAAEFFAGDDLFLMVNSDNYYPIDALRALRTLREPGLIGFEMETLIRESNVPAERVHKYAIIHLDAEDYMQRIIEKPDEETLASVRGERLISMNAWIFGPKIFRTCRNVRPSPRGELELQDAVQFAIDSLGERFKVLKFRGAVLDLSNRADIPTVTQRLQRVDVRL